MTTGELAALEQALSRLERRDPQLRRMSRRALAAQHALRSAVSRKAWDLYLRLEDLAGHHHDALLLLAIRVAFGAGRRRGQRDLLKLAATVKSAGKPRRA